MLYHLSHQFSHSSAMLKAVSARHLIQFLLPYASYLISRGLKLPASDDQADQLDYPTLLYILAMPSEDTPTSLTNALHCVDEMATPEAMVSLLEEAESRGTTIDGSQDSSPMDVAIQIWMHDRDILERKHAEQFLVKPCTFVYFQAEKHSSGEIRLSSEIVSALEHDLDKWFQRRRHGRGCRVFHFLRQDGIWFMVWHGAPFKRDGCIENGEPSCICYRPERHDVLIYQPATRELQIDADTNGEREVYRKFFGRRLFGDDHHFPGTAIYTLEPLMRERRPSLVCSDVPGMEWVRLNKIEFCWGGPIKSIETLQASDVFDALGTGEVVIPSGARITEACFVIKFSGSKVPRMVWIRPSNIIRFQRDSDCGPVERWLRLRGFVLTE